MKNLYIIVIAFFITVSSFAQNTFSVGPRVGVNFANVTNVDDSESLTGMAIGATSTYSISESTGVTLDLLYSKEGYKHQNGSEVDISYLQIPLYFNLFLGQLGEKFRPKIYAGLATGILLDGKQGTIDIKDDLSTINLSLSGGLGFNYRLSDMIWLNTDLRSYFGLTDIDNTNSAGDKIATRNLQLSLGVAFGL